jgi:preprotein translocase subunit SecG
MSVVVTVLHVIVCVFLIAVVLVQRGKGAQVGAVFGGGGGATMFGGRGAGNFLTKLTAGAAAVFMLTSLSLAYMRMNPGERLFESGAIEEEAEAEAAKPLPFEEIGKTPAEAPPAAEGSPPVEAPAPPTP